MEYLLRPLDSDYPDIWFDTNNINDLARLGGWDEDVVYVAGTAYHAPMNEKRPSMRIVTEYVRELESEAVAVMAERDRFVELCKTIQLWAEDENEERPVMPPWYLPLCDALFNSDLAAANEATP